MGFGWTAPFLWHPSWHARPAALELSPRERGDVPLDREDERTAQQRGGAGDEGVQRGEGEAGACGRVYYVEVEELC